MISNWLDSILKNLNLSSQTHELLRLTLIVIAVVLIAWFLTLIVRRVLFKTLTSWIQTNKFDWDDPLAANNLLTKISWFIPIAIFSFAIDSFFAPATTTHLIAKRLVSSGFVIVAVLSLSALLSSVNDIHRIMRKSRGSSIQGYTDAGKILLYLLGAIFLISIFTGKSPWGILSILGGLTAVVMLIFKDSILGFVASVQINSTDMIRLGDWIEMGKYNADGEVIYISIHSIRVQNWDKTITAIPTYALVSDSFKNWRGMSESGGRRIKRSLSIDMHSISFCDEKMLNDLSEITLISDYIRKTQTQIENENFQKEGSQNLIINSRNQTNIGIFRAYIYAYLKNNPNIHQSMTFLVRQLPPSANGLPLEIYVFSNDQEWANYEAIQSDIFDHLLAAAPLFGLRIFQNPTGYDFQQIREFSA